MEIKGHFSALKQSARNIGVFRKLRGVQETWNLFHEAAG